MEISHRNEGTCALARPAKAGGGVASVGLLGVYVPGNPVWGTRATLSFLCERRGRGAGGYPARDGGHSVCKGRLRRGMPEWNIRKRDEVACVESEGERVCHLIRVYGLEGERGPKKRSICDQPRPPIHVLGEGKCAYGVPSRVRFPDRAGRSFHFNGRREGVSALTITSIDEGLVHFPIRREILSLCRSSLRMGAIGSLVHAIYGSLHQGVARMGIPSFALHRRFLDRSGSRGNRFDSHGLQKGDEENKRTVTAHWNSSSEGQRRVERDAKVGTSRGNGRQFTDAFLGDIGEGGKGKEDVQVDVARCPVWSKMGAGQFIAIILRNMRLPFVGNALGKILHPSVILGPERPEGAGSKRPGTAFPPIRERLTVLGTIILRSGENTPNSHSKGPSIDAFRRCGHGVRRNAEHRGPGSRFDGYVVRSGGVELERSGKAHNIARAESNPEVANGKLRKEGAGEFRERPAHARRQRSRGSYYKQLRQQQSGNDERTSAVETRSRSVGIASACGVATIGGKSLRGRLVATIPPRRPPDSAFRAAFHTGWNAGRDGRVSLSTVGRTASGSSQDGVRRVISELEPERSEASMPADRSSLGHGPEGDENKDSSNPPIAGMASSSVVSNGSPHGQQSGSGSVASGQRVDRITHNQPQVASGLHGGKSLMLRLPIRRRREESRIHPSTAMAASEALVKEYAWSSRTLRSRGSQWKAWLAFCIEDDRTPLPVTEAHMVAFIGWLKLSRERGERCVSSRSIPQYLSAVRRMHLTLTGIAVPAFPYLDIVIRAYRKWEEGTFPQASVRCGLSADILQRIWALGMSSDDRDTVRECAACVFAFCFNGLRESTVMSVLCQNVTLTDDGIHVRVSMCKGREASHEQLLGYHRTGDMTSPIDVIRRWMTIRATLEGFLFTRAGEEHIGGELSRAMQRVLALVGAEAPPNAKYTSHSLRIGAHTEQVLIGIPYEARLARFGWKHTSGDMAALYFDRTIRTTTASYWFFGGLNGPPPTSIPQAPQLQS